MTKTVRFPLRGMAKRFSNLKVLESLDVQKILLEHEKDQQGVLMLQIECRFLKIYREEIYREQVCREEISLVLSYQQAIDLANEILHHDLLDDVEN